MKKIIVFFSLICVPWILATAQKTGVISGQVTDLTTQAPLSGASVLLQGYSRGAISDSLGRFTITSIPTGSYNVTISLLGYKTITRYNIILSSGNEQVLNFQLEPVAETLGTVVVSSRRRTVAAASIETPLSIQKLTTEEIKTNPGGNFDISRVIQSLPGVGGTSGSVGGYRNDIIIRGGAPNENVYYLDGIEVPVINHFATQGSAGGPTGILNVSFLDEVKLSSSAFNARYDNALSSVFQFRQKNGNLNRTQGNYRLSATEFAVTLDGPLSRKKKITYLASVRRSYLQLLFKALDLPIRPNYWDFQTKISYPVNQKTTISFIGIGALDDFSFTAPREASPEKLYSINANPTIAQKSYTIGITIKKTIPGGYWDLSLSRNHLRNNLDKFEDNNEPDESERMLRIRSLESENKLRLDINQQKNAWKISYGTMFQLVDYSNNAYTLVRKELTDENGNIIQPGVSTNFSSPINPFLKFGVYSQISRRFADNRIGISAGIRFDGNSFTSEGANLLKTFSPRMSLSYVLTEKWTASFSMGRYYKIPPYTILGFADNNGKSVNKNADYLRSDHLAAGLEYLFSGNTRITLEGFYKRYANVPVSIRNGISLSNLGGDFNVLGNEAVVTNGKEETYGFEFFAQQKLSRRFYGILSYTYFHSRYSGMDGILKPSSWDNRHLLSITAGYKLPRNWEIGLKFRYQGGAPYTPFDMTASQLNYLSQGTGIYQYSMLNTLRLNAFNSGDIRIDKKWNFQNWALNVYLDVTNWYGAGTPAYPQYTFRRNEGNTDFLTTDGQPVKANGSNAIPLILRNDDANIIPTIGFIIEM